MSSITDEEIDKLAHVHVKKDMGELYNKDGFDTFKNVEFFIDGYKAALQNKVSDPATEQSTSNWGKVGDKDKFMDEVRGNESGVSAWKEKAELRLKIREKAKEMFDRYAIYKDNPIAWSVWKIAFNTALNPQFNEKEYASIVNERKDNAVHDWIWLKELTDLVHKITDDSYNRQLLNHSEVDAILIPFFKKYFNIDEQNYFRVRNLSQPK